MFLLFICHTFTYFMFHFKENKLDKYYYVKVIPPLEYSSSVCGSTNASQSEA